MKLLLVLELNQHWPQLLMFIIMVHLLTEQSLTRVLLEANQSNFH